MGTKNYAGFTIIETMLFLAVSALLIFAMLAGTGASLNIQRYRDSVETFKSVLQQQYADLTSVVNSRDNSWGCSSTAMPSQGGATEKRGQSDCMIMGKYVRVENSDMQIYTVIGYAHGTAPQTNDVETLRTNYTLNVSNAEKVERGLEWGTYISWPKTINGTPNANPLSPRKFGMLVIRSPESGQIYTFTASDNGVPNAGSIGPSTFTNMLVAGNTVPGQGEQLICISTRGLFVNQDRAVYLSPFASSSSAVEIRSNDYLLANGGNEC